MQDETSLKNWLGKTQEHVSVIDTKQAELLAATLDQPAPKEGDPLPGCWHWAWFNDVVKADGLGRDGHPKRGGFLPPIALPRRMWAGGSFEINKPLYVGSTVTKKSTIDEIKQRNGKSGKLCIVTIAHDYYQADALIIKEKQNLVFREDPSPNAPKQMLLTPPSNAILSRTIMPDPVLMFRYSALTFNGHRIHYDVDYARNVEGYPDLVFHAPLTATLLFELACEIGTKPIKKFEYRATSPLFCNEPFSICGKNEKDKIITWAQAKNGGQSMLASASYG